MAVPPIYNPAIPCVHPIPGGLYPGRMIRIQGNTPPGAQRFAINFQCGPNTDPRDDIALHLNFRFVEQCVVRNHLTAMSWGVEDTSGGMPLQRGDSFEALILCEPQSLKVALNGVHFCEFLHRIPFQRVSHITVDGDVMIQLVGFEGAQPPPSQMYMSEPTSYGAYGAPPPTYGAPGYGPPQEYASMAPYETQTTYVQSQRRGLGTGAAVGLGVGALAAGGLAGYALAGGFSGDSPPREEAYASDYPPPYDTNTPSAPLEFDTEARPEGDVPTDLPDDTNEIPTEVPDQSYDIARDLSDQINEMQIELPVQYSEIPTELPVQGNEIPAEMPEHSNEIPTVFPDKSNEIPTVLLDQSNEIPTVLSDQSIEIPTDMPEDSNEIPTVLPDEANTITTGLPEIIDVSAEDTVQEDPDDSVQVSSFSEAVEFGGDDDWMD